MGLRIGNASGFYGDRFSAVHEMLTGGPLDVLTGDYLSELTMMILGRDRLRDPQTGYAKTFLRQMEGTLGLALEKGVRIVTNAGGLNPAGLAGALCDLAGRLGLNPKIAYVEGDDLLPRAEELGLGNPLTANAYLGAWGIAECLRTGADIVVTGRVTDASLVVGPAAAHFGWSRSDYDALAGAVVAGHILECGAQATGGNYSFFDEIPMGRLGFPIAEIHADGSSVIAKHPGTGGAVTVGTVTAQLLYEISGSRYPGPDVTARFDSLALSQEAVDRVLVTGARGEPPPPRSKVCLNHLDGWRNEVTFVLTGLDIDAKVALLRSQLDVSASSVEWTLLDGGLLRVVVRDPDPARVGRAFSSAAVELALSSYPGFTLTAPPSDATPHAVYTPAYVDASLVPHTAFLPDGSRVPIPPAGHVAAASGAGISPAGHVAAASSNVAIPPAGRLDRPDHSDHADHLGLFGRPDHGDLSDHRNLSGQHLGSCPVGDHQTGQLPGGLADVATRRAPLGLVAGARSGDKGMTANIGVWAKSADIWPWLESTLTVELFRELMSSPNVTRFVFPNLRALNFVVEEYLWPTRFDPQGKGLGETLRACHVDIPVEFL